MPLSIEDVETDRLARELSAATGESLTTAVATALRERLERLRASSPDRGLAAEPTAIALRCTSLPVQPDRHHAGVSAPGEREDEHREHT